ncbi:MULTISPECIES: T9SS type A sorting domain-containing protein [Chitinophagaceae]
MAMLLTAFLSFGMLRLHAQSYIINTVVGTGSTTINSDGSPGTSVNISYPRNSAMYNGELYFVDANHNNVKKYNPSTKQVTTVAGVANIGFTPHSGDNGAAISAQISNPWGIAITSDGIMYISELSGYTVRKVVLSTGIITTYAGNGTNTYGGDGGAAINAGMDAPTGLALDAAENLYVATNNSRIRKIATDGTITTIYSSGSVITGLGFDGNGKLYFSDAGNGTVSYIDLSTNAVTRYAGTGIKGTPVNGSAATATQLYAPQQLAFDAAGNLYIPDGNKNVILKVTKATGIISYYAGIGGAAGSFGGDGGLATSANLYMPYGLSFDASGGLYISDAMNNRIRYVTGGTSISGTVYDDRNGLKNSTVDGIGTNVGNTLFINLMDGSNKVVATAAVQAGGTYSLPNVAPGAYTLVLSTMQGTVGTTAPAATLPSNWVNTGEHLGTGAGSDGTADGKLAVTMAGTSIVNANFGIDQRPTANNVSTAAVPNGQLNLTDIDGYVGIASNSPYVLPLSGNDPEDGAIGTGGTFMINTIAANTLLIYYNGVQLTAGATTITDYDPALLKIYGQEGSNATTMSFTYSAIDAAGVASAPATYTINTAYALPVTLLPLNAAMANGAAVYLTWGTVTELNNKGFGIQRSPDATTWSTIAFVNSSANGGNSSLTLNYDYTDKAPLAGNNYYRLVQTDIDGKTALSNVVSIYVSGSASKGLTVYPNPASGTTTVSGLQAGNQLSIISMDGRTMKSLTATAATQQLDISGLPSGIYFVRTVADGKATNVKFMVK